MYEQTKQFIYKMLKDQVMPGCNVAFLSNNGVEYLNLGYYTYQKKQAIKQEVLFDLASLTKVIGTTPVILQLIEKEELTLNTPVKQFLSIKSDQLLIRHLLTHTSDFQGFIVNRDQLSSKKLKQALLNEMQPGVLLGKKVQYSDINYLYLGWIAEVIYKKNIHQIIKEQVLDKLGKNHFTFTPSKELCAPTEKDIQGRVHDPKAAILGKHCGSAGLFGTVEDVLNFGQIFLNAGLTKTKERLLSEKTIQSLNRRYTPLNEQSRSLGFVYEQGYLTHTGYTGTYLAINFETKEVFVFLSNRIQPVDDKELYLKYRDQLIDIYLSDKSGYML